MITLNSERGFVKVENWSEIQELPGFTSNLDPSRHELNEIIGRYVFKNHIKCGLSTCHTPHGKGYVVSTKSGFVTNIGSHCGKTHFDVEFDDLSKKFEREITDYTHRTTIANFLVTLELHEENVSRIRAGKNGADSINRKVTSIITRGKGCPDEIVFSLQKLLKNRDPVVKREVELSRQEFEQLKASGQKNITWPQYKEVAIAELKGFQVLYPESDLRKLLVLDIVEGLKTLRESDVDAFAAKELKYWAAWCLDLERKIESVEVIVKYGSIFFAQENLSVLSTYAPDRKSELLFNEFLKNLL